MTPTPPDLLPRIWIRTYRIIGALLVIAAIAWQLWVSHDEGVLNVGNFFSFFTIQSNVIGAIVLLIGATTIPRFTTEPTWEWDMIRGATVMYLTTTGIVYATLLTGLEEDLRTSDPVVNVILHQVMPLLVFLDFIVVPIRQRITMQQALAWTVYPLLYLVVTLIRGPLVAWYPYPFIDPREAGGYSRVGLYCVTILLGFLLISWVILRLAEWRYPPEDD